MEGEPKPSEGEGDDGLLSSEPQDSHYRLSDWLASYGAHRCVRVRPRQRWLGCSQARR